MLENKMVEFIQFEGNWWVLACLRAHMCAFCYLNNELVQAEILISHDQVKMKMSHIMRQNFTMMTKHNLSGIQ